MFYILALVAIAGLVSVDSGPIESKTRNNYPVLVLSFDGVSVDRSKQLTSLAKVRNIAASPGYLKSVFPTKTFSTHFSVSTGELPAVHGVIGNEQYDIDGEKIRNHPHQYRFVSDITPIWVENELSGKKSGTMMWPGAQFLYKGKVKDPNMPFVKNFEDDGCDEEEEKDGSHNDDDNYEGGKKAHYRVDYKPQDMEWEDRADIIIDWLTGKEPANLVMAYFEDFGSIDPDKKEIEKAAHFQKVNDIIKYILDKLKTSSLNNEVDVIIMSDHGTSPTVGTDILVIDDILEIENEQKNIISSGPLVYITPEQKDIEKVITQLNAASNSGEKYKVYRKADLKWGMKDCGQILDNMITVVANPTYTFYTKQKLRKIMENYGLDQSKIVQDVNGYDNEHPSMNGFFYGIGPSFKDDEHLESEKYFSLEEVYPLIKVLIGLPLTNSSSVQKNNDLDPTLKELLEDGVSP